MNLGASIFLIAVGAILKFAVTASVAGIHLHIVGVILMIVGGVALILSLFLMQTAGNRRVVETQVYQDPPPPPAPPAGY